MAGSPNPLILQLLEWLSARERTYAEVMDAWRTSCPRLSIWEDASMDGLVRVDGATGVVTLTARGLTLLAESPSGRPAAR